MNSTTQTRTISKPVRIVLNGAIIAAITALATVIMLVATWQYGMRVGKEFADHWYLIRASMPLYLGVLAATTLATLYITSCARAGYARVLDAIDSHETSIRREAFAREDRIVREIRELAVTIRDPLASLVNDSTAIAARLADLGADIQPTVEVTQQLGEDLGALLELLRESGGTVGDAMRAGLSVEESDEVTGNRWFDGAMEAIRQKAEEIDDGEEYSGVEWADLAVTAACYEGAIDAKSPQPPEHTWLLNWTPGDRQHNLTLAGALYLIAANKAGAAGVGHAHDHKLAEARRVAVLLAHHVKTEHEKGEAEARGVEASPDDEFMPPFKPMQPVDPDGSNTDVGSTETGSTE